jgi:hypothetical protein
MQAPHQMTATQAQVQGLERSMLLKEWLPANQAPADALKLHATLTWSPPHSCSGCSGLADG